MTHLCGPVRRIRAANPFRIGGDYLKSWRRATSGDEEGGVSRPDQVRPPKRCLSGGETLPGFPYVAALNGAWRLTQVCRPARRIRPANPFRISGICQVVMAHPDVSGER